MMPNIYIYIYWFRKRQNTYNDVRATQNISKSATEVTWDFSKWPDFEVTWSKMRLGGKIPSELSLQIGDRERAQLPRYWKSGTTLRSIPSSVVTDGSSTFFATRLFHWLFSQERIPVSPLYHWWRIEVHNQGLQWIRMVPVCHLVAPNKSHNKTYGHILCIILHWSTKPVLHAKTFSSFLPLFARLVWWQMHAHITYVCIKQARNSTYQKQILVSCLRCHDL